MDGDRCTPTCDSEGTAALRLYYSVPSDCPASSPAPAGEPFPRAFIVSTAAACHDCNDVAIFETLQGAKTFDAIQSMQSVIGRGPGTPTLGTGTVQIATRKGSVMLHDVKYAPGSICNILSVPCLSEMQQMSFGATGCRMMLKDGTELEPMQVNGLPYLPWNLAAEEQLRKLPKESSDAFVSSFQLKNITVRVE